MIMFAASIETVCVCSWWPLCLRSQTMQSNDVIGKHVPCPILIDNDGILFNNDRQTTAQYHVTPLISDDRMSTMLHDIRCHVYVADILCTKHQHCGNVCRGISPYMCFTYGEIPRQTFPQYCCFVQRISGTHTIRNLEYCRSPRCDLD